MNSKKPTSNMLPFRDTDNKAVAYGENPNAPAPSLDSDSALLVPQQGLDEDAMENFTATGHPAPQFKWQGLQSLGGGDMYSLPQLLPKRYTDDSIIPAIVTDVVPSEKTVGVGAGKKGGFWGKFKGKKEDEVDTLGQKKGITKVVYMPRREYLKSFAKDEKGEYIGSEPYRRWTEGELEDEFGKYKPEVGKK
jgi:hypothetical protein